MSGTEMSVENQPAGIDLRDHQASPLLTIFETNVVIRSDCREFRRAWLHLAVKTGGGKKVSCG